MPKYTREDEQRDRLREAGVDPSYRPHVLDPMEIQFGDVVGLRVNSLAHHVGFYTTITSDKPGSSSYWWPYGRVGATAIRTDTAICLGIGSGRLANMGPRRGAVIDMLLFAPYRNAHMRTSMRTCAAFPRDQLFAADDRVQQVSNYYHPPKSPDAALRTVSDYMYTLFSNEIGRDIPTAMKLMQRLGNPTTKIKE